MISRDELKVWCLCFKCDWPIVSFLTRPIIDLLNVDVSIRQYYCSDVGFTLYFFFLFLIVLLIVINYLLFLLFFILNLLRNIFFSLFYLISLLLLFVVIFLFTLLFFPWYEVLRRCCHPNNFGAELRLQIIFILPLCAYKSKRDAIWFVDTLDVRQRYCFPL